MKVLVIDTDNLEPQIVETEGGLEEWYRLIKCDLIDIVSRKIGGRYFDIIADDEALLKAGGKVTGLDTEKQPMLVGNLVICNYDSETGGETSLTDMDIAHIKEQLVILAQADTETPQRWLAVSNMDY